MWINIAANDGVPIYMQIVQQVKYQVASGRLAPEEQLPSVRALACQLSVNPNTVARAYRELEAEGVIRTRAGAGVYVEQLESPLADKEKKRILSERADQIVTEAKQMGVDLPTLLEIVRQRGEQLK